MKFDKIDLNRDGEIDALELVVNSFHRRRKERIDLRRDKEGGVELLNETELLGNWTVRIERK